LTPRRIFFAVLAAFAAALLAASLVTLDTSAQQKPADVKSGAPVAPKAPPSEVQAPSTQQQSLPIPIEQALYLIRSTLLTLNDANRSGNYSVLRDLAAPDFQARYTAADLAQIFSDLRRRKFDLHGAALLAPKFSAIPALDQNGMLRLTGFFQTHPQQTNFDLLFQLVAGEWRLDGISIATPEAAPTQPEAQAQPANPNAPAAKKR
jgi:hypothetical protein